MNYIYYQSDKGNFGDDLNEWLWPNFFGEHNQAAQTAFFGIGSILCNDSPLIKSLNAGKKIVFGTGIRPAYIPFKYDSSWDIRFLRGPLSALSLGNKHKYIADAAYAFRLTDQFEDIRHSPKKYEVSILPYFKSLDYFDWGALCKKMNCHFISPESGHGIEHTLREIASSKYLITEALHGAILADALRVPWHRFVLTTPYTEGPMVPEFKWMDWLYSINLPYPDTTSITFLSKMFLNTSSLKIGSGAFNLEVLLKSRTENGILKKLSQIKDYCLSADSIISEIDARISEEIKLLKKEGY